jgi:uncharacterized protein (TIGR03437 family)
MRRISKFRTIGSGLSATALVSLGVVSMYSQGNQCDSALFSVSPSAIAIAWDSPPIPGTMYSGEFSYGSSISACVNSAIVTSSTQFIQIAYAASGHGYFWVDRNLTGQPRGGYIYVGTTNLNRAALTISQGVQTSQPAVTTAGDLPKGTVGVFYSFNLTASGGVPPYTWPAGILVPDGLRLSASGSLSGTPTVAGRYSISVFVNDSLGHSSPLVNVSLEIQPAPLTIVTSGDLPSATVGTPYNFNFAAAGGVPPYSWPTGTLLPAGLKLSASGLLSGTPTAAGRFPITLTVRDSVGQSSPSVVLMIDVRASQTGPSPVFNGTGVVNTADYTHPLAPGGLFSIFGSNLSTSTGPQSLPLPIQVTGTQVTVNGVPAPLLYVSPGQLNAQMPAVAPGNSTIKVQSPGGTATSTIVVSSVAPAVFNNSSVAIAQNLDGSLNGPSKPANRGTPIVVYATGFGTLTPPVPIGSPASTTQLSRTSQAMTATIGGRNATVQFAGATPAFVGLNQANVLIPADAPIGGSSLVLTLGNTVSKSATVYVADSVPLPPPAPPVSPGSMLSISGSFDPSATTYVAFTDASGHQIQVAPVALDAQTAVAPVPPFLNPKTYSIGPGSYNVSVVQKKSTGQTTSTTPKALAVDDLPTTSISPGLITLAMFDELSRTAGAASQTWNGIATATSNAVDSSRLKLPLLQSVIGAGQAKIQALVSGRVAKVSLGQIAGREVYLDMSSVALLDRLILAYVRGANSTGKISLAVHTRDAAGDELTQFVSDLKHMISSDLPEGIRTNARNIRGVAGVAVGLAVIVTAPADIALAAGASAGAIAWFATTWVSAAIAAPMEGAGTLILSDEPAKVSDFKNTIGILTDGYVDALISEVRGSVAELAGEGGQIANSVVDTVQGVVTLMHPEDPNSVASETIANAPSIVASNISLIGNWTGTYSYSGGICNWQSSGQFTLTFTSGSAGSFSGTASITNAQARDDNCNVSGYGDSVSGNVSATVSAFSLDGQPVPGLGIVNGQASFAMSIGPSITFSFSATVIGDSLIGSFSTGTADQIGSFDVHR